MIDHGREAVYAAELAAFDGTSYERLTDLVTLQSLAYRITNADWWPRGDVTVVAARADAASSATYLTGASQPIVRLAAGQMTMATLTHELSHALAGVGNGHGPTFRRAHVDVVEWAFGGEPAEWLLDAYQAMGVGVGDRSWRPPTAHAIV